MSIADVITAIQSAQATLQTVVQNNAAGSTNVVTVQTALASLQTALADAQAIQTTAGATAACPTPPTNSLGTVSTPVTVLIGVGAAVTGGLIGWVAREKTPMRANPLRRTRR